MTSPYVCISYSRQDRQFVERLSRELQLAGVETWTDTQNISAGANWQQEANGRPVKAITSSFDKKIEIAPSSTQSKER